MRSFGLHVRWKLAISALALALTAIGCTSETWGCGMGAACPALADVGDVRYSIGGSRDLIDVEPDLVPFGLISRTNVPENFADLTVFAIGDIDPSAVLVARAAPQPQDDAGPYRLLFAFRGNTDPAWPALCQYLTAEQRAAQPKCPKENK